MRHFFAGASVLVSDGLLCSGYFCDGRNHVCNSGFVVHLSGNVLIHCILSLVWFTSERLWLLAYLVCLGLPLDLHSDTHFSVVLSLRFITRLPGQMYSISHQ